MKLKYIEVDELGILVDESAVIEEEDNYRKGNYNYIADRFYARSNNDVKIIFADPELNLDVPEIPNLKEWEVEQLANSIFKQDESWDEGKLNWVRKGFISGYNHNKAEFTKEDLVKAITKAWNSFGDNDNETITEAYTRIVKSLQKSPKFIVMESDEKFSHFSQDLMEVAVYRKTGLPKITTNLEGRQVGIIKEIIY